MTWDKQNVAMDFHILPDEGEKKVNLFEPWPVLIRVGTVNISSV